MFLYKVGEKITNSLFRLLYKVKIEGSSNIPHEQGYMICSNHIHAFDVIFINACTKHQVLYLAKKELFSIPILSSILKTCGVIPIDREKPDINIIRKAIDVLKSKKVLSIFPEGTRHRDGKFGEIKSGAALIAIQANSKIVPMRIIGNYKPFSKMTLKIGKPISSFGFTKDELTEKLKIAIENLGKVA